MSYNDSWQDLVQADQYINQAFANIERQQQIVGELANNGGASLEAARALETMRSLLTVMCRHREQIAAFCVQVGAHRLGGFRP